MTAGSAQMRFEVLGPLRVRRGDEVLSLGPKPRALLGTLLLHPGEPVGVEQLTEALWDGEPPASALGNLRTYVRTVRRALDPTSSDDDSRLQTKAPGYLIRVESGELDLQDFQDLDARARKALERGEIGDAARLWRRALDLWRDRPLVDVRGGPRLDAAVVRLEEHRLRVTEAWIDAQLALGAHAEVVSELRGMVTAGPLNEPLWARLMVALHRAGRTADALAAYTQARTYLIDELGMEPGPQLQRVHRAILAGDAVVHVDGAASNGASFKRSPSGSGAQFIELDPPAVDVCPYQGLTPFDTADAEWFFGRERLVAELVAYLSSQLTPPSMLAAVGPSGSGKSSLLRAGLVPALTGGVLPEARDWPAVVLTPGERPVVALAEAIASVQILGTNPPDLDMLVDPQQTDELVRRTFGPEPERRLVIVVDQFEELFMLCKDERERQAFVTSLCNVAGAGRGTDTALAVVVLGLRADFYGHCIAYPELIPVLSGSQVVVGPMTEADLRQAIERPAARAGLAFEPGLVDVLLADIGLGSTGGTRPEPGSLPLLSHALLATWRLRDGHRLTMDGYRKAGGVHGAIAATAEAVYDRLTPDERTIVRQLFTRLVAFGEGTDDTSRRIHHDELLDGRTVAEADTARAVLDAIAQARLIVLGSDTVELAHEALITRWPRLQQWLTDDREGLRIHRALTEAASGWKALGHDPGALYRGARLAIARQWAERDDHRSDMNARERAFLDASVELESSDEAAVRRRTRTSRQVVTAIVILVLLAVAGGAFALWHAKRNTEHERNARSQELARAALSLPTARRPTAMLLAVEAFRTAPTPQARGALAALTPQEGYMDTIMPSGGVSAVSFSPDGEILAEGNDDGTVTLWDPEQRAKGATLAADGVGATETIAFRPDGQLLASGHADGTVHIWDPAGRSLVATLTVGDPVFSLAFSPDGSILAGGTADGLVLWDPASRSRLATLSAGAGSGAPVERRRDEVTSVAFSPDGSILASGGAGGALVLWDPASQSRLATLTAGDAAVGDPVDALAFSPDGTILAAAQSTPVTGRPEDAGDESVPTHPIALWNVQRRTATTVGSPNSQATYALAFSPDGNALALGMTAGVVVLDVSGSPDAIAPVLRYVGEPVGSLAFSPDGGTLAINEGTAAITLLDPSSPQIIGLGTISQFATSPDGTLLATAGDGPHVDVWDVAAKKHVMAFGSEGYVDADVAFSPSGEWVGVTGWDVVTLYHVRGEMEHRRVRAVRRPDDTRIPALGGPRSIGLAASPMRVYVADSYHEVVLVYAPNENPSETRIPGLRTAALSPNHDVLATAATSGVMLWSVPEMSELGEIGPLERFETQPIVAFSEDGSTLATADRELITLWDVEERTPIASFTADAPPIDIAVAPDDRTVAVLAENDFGKRQVTVWDAADGLRFADLKLDTYAAGDVEFHANGSMVASTEDEKMRFWDVDPALATRRICTLLDRGLTRDEWAEFFGDQPYRTTCGGSTPAGTTNIG